MDLENIIAQATEIVRDAGQFILEERKSFNSQTVSDKSLNQLVSYVDIKTEKKLVAGLKTLIPNAGFIGEEDTNAGNEKGDFVWIIDPLDGTTNFIHGLPVYCISVGLLHQKEVVGGIIYEMNRGEMFTAWKNGGAYLNNQKIGVTQTASLKDSLIATGFPYYDFDKMQAYLQVLNTLMKSTRGLRRMGSAAIDLAYTACGRFDAFFEYSLSPWDVAGGACIVQEAGGMVCDFRGEDNFLFGKEIIACNPYLAKEFTSLIKQNFHS